MVVHIQCMRNTFFHEFQLLAAQGYGVLYVNPRGSHGYSQAFVDGVRGDYGGGDYEDIMAGLDYVFSTTMTGLMKIV